MLGSILGGIGGSAVAGLFGQSSARDQMSFQERMSGSAHQRQVKDLRKAGLNPLLSAQYGGSSTPQGAMATMPDPQLGNTINSARMAKVAEKRNEAEIDLMRAQTAKTDVEAKVVADQSPWTTVKGRALQKAEHAAKKVKSVVQDSSWSPSTPIQNMKAWRDYFK